MYTDPGIEPTTLPTFGPTSEPELPTVNYIKEDNFEALVIELNSLANHNQ